jgi:hypothetical protein
LDLAGPSMAHWEDKSFRIFRLSIGACNGEL